MLCPQTLERGEELVKVGGGDAWTRVADRQSQVIRLRPGVTGDGDRSARTIVLHGVGEEVEHHLAQTLPVRPDGIRAGPANASADSDIAFCRQRLDEGSSLVADRRYGNCFRAQLDFAAFDAGNVEHLID